MKALVALQAQLQAKPTGEHHVHTSSSLFHPTNRYLRSHAQWNALLSKCPALMNLIHFKDALLMAAGGLQFDDVLYIVQTPHMRNAWAAFGEGSCLCVDTTFGMGRDKKQLLCFSVVHQAPKRSVPVLLALINEETTRHIQTCLLYLAQMRKVAPQCIMSDDSRAMLGVDFTAISRASGNARWEKVSVSQLLWHIVSLVFDN